MKGRARPSPNAFGRLRKTGPQGKVKYMNGKILLKALSLILCLLSIAAASPAQAAKQSMFYDVYAGGIHVLEAKLDITMGGGKYDIALSASTFGFLAKLVPWKGTFESNGWIMKDGTLRPQLHRSEAFAGEEYDLKEYKYSREGKFLSYNEVQTEAGQPKKKGNRAKKFDIKVTQGTTDALSATLEVLSKVGAGEKCDGSAEIFDGKRRFREIFTDVGADDLVASSYNVFSGSAAACEIQVEPLAGEWSKKPRGWMSIQDQGRQNGGLPTMWAGTLMDKGPALPVKIRIKTGYGTLMMHMSEYHAGDVALVSKKRQK